MSNLRLLDFEDIYKDIVCKIDYSGIQKKLFLD